MKGNRKQLFKKHNHLYRLYCPSKELRYVCFYCGLPAGTVDHVPPLAAVDDLRSSGEHLNCLKVPSCQNCNSLAADEPHTNIFDRQIFVKERIRARYKKYLRLPDWEEAEIQELGFRLKQSVQALMEMKYLLVYRLEYGLEKKYSLIKPGYENFDPEKILKYGKPSNWDKTLAKVESEKHDLTSLEQALSHRAKGEEKGYSFLEARQVARRLKIEGSAEYFKWRRENKTHHLRHLLPPSPPQEFKEVWSGWKDFLGENYRNKSESAKVANRSYVSYEEAKKLALEAGIYNSVSYGEKRRASSELAKLLPSSPKDHYVQSWPGWPEFLGENYRNQNHSQNEEKTRERFRLYLPYERAQALALKTGIVNSATYFEKRKASSELLESLPPDPRKHYGSQWISWREFLGKSYRNKNEERSRKARLRVHNPTETELDEYFEDWSTDDSLSSDWTDLYPSSN